MVLFGGHRGRVALGFRQGTKSGTRDLHSGGISGVDQHSNYSTAKNQEEPRRELRLHHHSPTIAGTELH